MKFIKSFLVLFIIFNIVVCSAEENKVFFDVTVSENKDIASIDVLSDNDGEEMSESDIIVYIKETVEQCREDGAGTIILTVTEKLVNEENVARVVDGIDVICVNESSGEKTDCIINDTTVVYVSDEVQSTAAKNASNSAKESSNPNETLSSMVLMSFVLIAIALIVLLAVKKKMKK